MQKLPPGGVLRVRWGENGVTQVSLQTYWSLSEIPPAAPNVLSLDAGTRAYTERLRQAVEYRLISDVPVGSFLSGGIDSTLVSVMGVSIVGEKLPCYTMGFDDPALDESHFARDIAGHIGAVHRVFQIEDQGVLTNWDRLWTVYDEPFADPSALPTVALCDHVAREVKVVLSGDGGDEVFGGYPWHRAMAKLARWSWLPGTVRALVGLCSGLIPDGTLAYQGQVFSGRDRISQWANLRTAITPAMRRFLPVEGAEYRPPFSEYLRPLDRTLHHIRSPVDWAGRMDLGSYLPDNLMVKADRASMRFGLELRAPMLDHDLTAWCLMLPEHLRYDIRNHRSKLLARQVLAQHLPRRLFERPKRGFTPPLQAWLNGPLREALENTLTRLTRGDLAPIGLPYGFRDFAACDAALGHNQAILWRLVCFNGWLNHHRELVRR